jgi:CRP/FNR family transcriptional regulator, cyclic AMP receptor protein
MARKLIRGTALNAFLELPGPGRGLRPYANKEVIYAQGNPANAVFYIQSGIVKLTMVSRQKKAVVSILQVGDFFGEACLGRQGRRMSTATAIGTSVITRLEKATFRRELERDPVLADFFITFLLSQIDRFKEDLADHFLNSSSRRLARILLIHAGSAQKLKSGRTALQLSQTTLAEMVGTTRARISFFMNDFRKKGYIRYNGNLQIDSDRLGAFLQG